AVWQVVADHLQAAAEALEQAEIRKVLEEWPGIVAYSRKNQSLLQGWFAV
ncbi:hypothetical protein FRX31_007600, partial [Thalictrum thalictroides]